MGQEEMKARPILVLLLFVGAVGMVGWMYYAISRPTHTATPATAHDGLHDLNECCRRNLLKATQYDHFAQIAREEQNPSAAALFRALAHSERIQEANCATIIGQLGGNYRPPTRILLFRGTTTGNLHRSLDYERRSADSLLHTRMLHHLRHGYRRIAEALIRSAVIDFRHQQLLEAQLASPTDTMYAVCPTCGNLYSAAACEPFCPHCLTEQARFVVIGH